jgi:hypothetical protein
MLWLSAPSTADVSQPAVDAECRRARDGNEYSYSEFEDHYGLIADVMWAEAGLEDAVGASQPGAGQLAVVAPQAAEAGLEDAVGASQLGAGHLAVVAAQAAGAGLEDAVGASQPGAGQLAVVAAQTGEDPREVVLSPDDLAALRRAPTRREELHDRMRAWLDEVARSNPQQRCEAVPIRMDAPADLPWKEYLAKHKESDRIVGDGLASFSLCFIAGTRDPNRHGQMRLDFVAESLPLLGDAEYIYLHPGTTPKTDAKVRYVHAPAEKWMLNKDTALKNPLGIPPHLRYGWKRSADVLRRILQGVPDRTPIDITEGVAANGERFPYWLWLANLGEVSLDLHARCQVSALVACTCENDHEAGISLNLRFDAGEPVSLHVRGRAST